MKKVFASPRLMPYGPAPLKRGPVAQLDRALPSEGKAPVKLVTVSVEKNELNQAIGETQRKHENRIRGRGSTTEANRKEVVEYEWR